ncbi:hypothetical protein ACQP1W_52440 (plasmid) [Spirillospora sp. CA-255316]
MARQRHTMTKVRWALLTLGTAALALVFLASDDVTVRFTAAFAYAFGAITLAISEGIIRNTRNSLETRMANARAGSIER